MKQNFDIVIEYIEDIFLAFRRGDDFRYDYCVRKYNFLVSHCIICINIPFLHDFCGTSEDSRCSNFSFTFPQTFKGGISFQVHRPNAWIILTWLSCQSCMHLCLDHVGTETKRYIVACLHKGSTISKAEWILYLKLSSLIREYSNSSFSFIECLFSRVRM